MQSLYRCLAPAGPCGYLPDQTWRLEYEIVGEMSLDEYMARMESGWRRFGHSMFRPRCQACSECRSLRVRAADFRPNRSQARVRRMNENRLRLQISAPALSREKLQLYDLYHDHQSQMKGWPGHPPKDAHSYRETFIDNPFDTEEWCYYLKDRLVGVGYVDRLPRGLSAIYYFYDPRLRQLSLGTWNVLCVLDAARARGLPWVYLGYYVAGSPSMVYKAAYRPHQLLGADGCWHDHLAAE